MGKKKREKRCPCDIDPSCLDCKEDTFAMREYYMVRNRLWQRAVPVKRHQRRQLCIGCLEARIGRRLTPRDFTRAPVNEDYTAQSRRLRNRLGAPRLPRRIEGRYRMVLNLFRKMLA